MATYPIKMLKDEAGNPFLPLTSPSAVKDPNNTSWQDLIDGKIDEPATEGTSGQVLTTDGNGGRTWTDGEEVYSTTETRIGTWIDRKPLYRTTIELGNLPNASAVSINHNISDIDKIVKAYGFASEQGTGWYIMLPNVGATQATSVVLSASKTVIYIVPGNDRSNWLGWVTLEYTKTTD